ncbi:DUF305 domain-containing protein [Utexia brackfieldae]|uniref:CopM family metallochaperone n=1 Tax=Utexia brackfieldae TaxID=3074108 RepID=UPI00370DB09C
MKKITLLPLLLVLALPVGVMAQPQSAAQSHAQSHSQSQAPTEAEKAYMRAMDAMHTPMMQGVMNSDPDVAFIKGMIPHHQGAIDMAKIVIQYGKDPAVRQLAEQVIKAQEGEIVWMNQWLAEHAPATK